MTRRRSVEILSLVQERDARSSNKCVYGVYGVYGVYENCRGFYRTIDGSVFTDLLYASEVEENAKGDLTNRLSKLVA